MKSLDFFKTGITKFDNDCIGFSAGINIIAGGWVAIHNVLALNLAKFVEKSSNAIFYPYNSDWEDMAEYTLDLYMTMDKVGKLADSTGSNETYILFFDFRPMKELDSNRVRRLIADINRIAKNQNITVVVCLETIENAIELDDMKINTMALQMLARNVIFCNTTVKMGAVITTVSVIKAGEYNVSSLKNIQI